MTGNGKRKRGGELPLTGILAGLVVVLLLCAMFLGGMILLKENGESKDQQRVLEENVNAGSLESAEETDAGQDSGTDTETANNMETNANAASDSGNDAMPDNNAGTDVNSVGNMGNGEDSDGTTETDAESDADSDAQTDIDVKAESEIDILIEAEETEAKEKLVVVIDPGHQGSWVDMSATEPIGPGVSEEKARSSTGTTGRYSGVPEYELNLTISLLLRTELENRGYEVVLTREDNDTAISNSERALLAYEEGGDIFVRIHANGSDNSDVNGALAMVPSPDNPYVGYLAEDSWLLADCILSAYCEKASFASLGIQYYDNMAGINWSKIPVMILEMGFMTNESDDLRMEEEEVQALMVEGIADGIDNYFEQKGRKDSGTQQAGDETEDGSGDGANGDGVRQAGDETNGGGDEENDSETQQTSEEMTALLEQLGESQIYPAQDTGEDWAVSLIDLTTGAAGDINGDVQMKSASVLKVFIMAAIYDRVCYPSSEDRLITVTESYDGELKELITNMITVSDNDAANSLVRMLGSGDSEAGMAVVNQFCEENGFTQTRMGRLFLESDPSGDNYTSANDCRNLLAAICNGTCVNEEASAKMYEYLKNQTRTNKIPAALTETSAAVANKTGELAGDYGDYVENDIAIVEDGDTAYVLCVLSGNLSSNSAAVSRIMEISRMVYSAL